MKTRIIITSIILLVICNVCFSQISFGTQKIIDSLPNGFVHVHAGDLDGDGDNDVVGAYIHCLKCYINDGNGLFNDSFELESNVTGVQCIYIEDLDGDNDLDVIADLGSSLDQIVWYENDGNANFSPKHIITELTNNPHCVYSCDLDGDDDNDVLSASVQDDKIAWYKNNGNGNFGEQLIISETTNGASSVFSCDIDGDGDNDVLAGAAFDNTIIWYENTNGQGDFDTPHVISSNVNGLQFAYAEDLDGDLDMDVLSASMNDDKFAWFENDGNGNFGSQHLIDFEEKASDICAQDLDNDGDFDIITSADDGTLSWFENNGLGEFSNQMVISDQNNRCVYSSDLNGDGYPDILSASFYEHKIAWFENLKYVRIDENEINKIMIYPNPANDFIKFKLTNESIQLKNCTLNITDIFGQQQIVKLRDEMIDTSILPCGIYAIFIYKDGVLLCTQNFIKN